MEKLTPEQKTVVDEILARATALNYELPYEEPETLPLLHPVDRAKAEADARAAEDLKREPTAAEIAEADRLLAAAAAQSVGMPLLKPAETVDQWHDRHGRA